MSQIESEDSYLTSTDLGFMRVDLKMVRGYDIEDVVRGKSISLARKIQFMNLAPQIDQSAPTNDRTIKSVFLNNLEGG